MIVCPNFKNPEVAREFEELKNATSEKAAYRIWSLNGGNAIDKAPNGAQSKLFDDLLSLFNGDKQKAIQAKAKVYSSSFFNWFGDWTSESKENVSKVVDENGEPFVVYHHDVSDKVTDFGNREKASYPVFYFSTTPRERYGDNQYQCYLNFKNPIYDDAAAISDSLDGQDDSLQNIIDNGHDSAIGLYSMMDGSKKPDLINIEDIHEFAAFDPNQIKHIENLGTWSTEDNNIYLSESSDINDVRNEFTQAYKDADTISNSKEAKDWINKTDKERKAISKNWKEHFQKNYPHVKLKLVFDKERYVLYARALDKDNKDLHQLMELLKINEIGSKVDLSKETLSGLIEFLYKQTRGIDYNYTAIIDILSKALSKANISIVVTNANIKKAAYYNHNNKTIYINKNAAFNNDLGTTNNLVQTLMHELLHAVTVQSIKYNKEIYNELNSLLNKVKKSLGEQAKDYGLTDVFEFVAELSNPDFVRKLRNIKTGSDRKQVVNIIKKIYDVIKESINRFLFAVNQHHRGTAYADAVELLLKATFPERFNLELESISTVDNDIFFSSSNLQNNISQHQKKAQQVSEQITKRFYILYKAYEKLPNKSPRRQRIQNEIFEKFNELKQTQDYHAVNIALNFALENLGTWDDVEGKPTKEDSISGYLYKQSKLDDPFSEITPDILVDMWKNSIGFYDDLLSNYIPDNLDEQMSAEDRALVKELKSLINDTIKPMWLRAMYVVGDRIIDQIIDQEVAASNEDKENMKAVAKDWLHKNIMYGDINAVTSYLYNNSYSSNPIIKQAFHLIQHAETKTLEEIQPIARRIVKQYQKANKLLNKRFSANWQTVLMEFNDKGIPTGNFVRPVNYGQYEEDLTEFVKNLNDEFENKYGYYYVDDGTGVIVNSLTGELADNEEWGPNGEEPTYIEYLKRIEQFKCERANRRYNLNYYMERLSKPYKGSLDPNDVDINKYGHGLSPKTLARYNYIQSNINYYLDLCTDKDTGLSHPERLSIADKQKLDDWKYELDKLSNPYNEDATPKLDEDRQIAFEIRAWQKWLGDQLYSQVDFKRFERELDKIIKEAQDTNNPQLYHDFIKYNSQYGINPDFIEQTIGSFNQIESSDPASIHAKLLKRSLQNLVKTRNGYTRDLRKMEDCPTFWLDCKHTDQIIEDCRVKQDSEFAEMMEENFSFQSILYRDEFGFAIDSNGNQVKPEEESIHNDLLTYQQYMINKYTTIAINSPSRTIPGLNDSNGNPIVFNGDIETVKRIMSKLFTYKKERIDKFGNIEIVEAPLTVFSMMIPRKDQFFNTKTGRKENTMLNVPTGRFAEKQDKRGIYMNRDYDHNDLNSEQPKIDYIDSEGNARYDNSEAYDNMSKDKEVLDLYNILIEEMQNAQQNYSTKNRRFNYRLPQINAHTSQLLSRTPKLGAKKTADLIHQSAFNVEENDESMRTSEDYVTNPDGTIATDIPLKYVRKLKNPESITTDIAGSVILFVEMALNYKNKLEIDSRLKALRYNMDFENRKKLYNSTKMENEDELSPFDNENSINMYDSMLNKHVYGNQWSINPNQPNTTKNQVQVSPFRKLLNNTIIGATSGAASGAMWGLMFGAPGTGAILGASVFGGIGLLTGAVQAGYFDGIAFLKTMKNIQRLETTQTLSLNMFSILVGFGDSLTRIFKESIMGKYMTIRDTSTAFASVLAYTPQCIANIGNPLANNKLTRMMQLNGISKGTRQLYENLNYGRVRRIGSNLLMGGFSMVDWMANALLMRSFYNNVRFYDGDVVEKGFYSRYELEQAFLNAGSTKAKAKVAHAMSTQTLWGAYDNDGYLKPEYEQYVDQIKKTGVRTKSLHRGALYNGMNPDNDIPRWKQDLIGSVVGALRAWLAQAVQHLFAGGTDNVVRKVAPKIEKEVRGTTTKNKQTRQFVNPTAEEISRRFSWNYETGTPQDQIAVGIFRSFKTLGNKLQRLMLLDFAGAKERKLSDVEKYAWKDAIVYLGILGLMMYGWTFVNDWAADVPKPKDRYHAAPESLSPIDSYNYITDVYIPNEYYKLQINNIMFRIVESQITSIDPKSSSDVINSVTALKNGLGEHLGVISALSDISGMSEHTIDEVVKQGGYKYYTRGERYFYKFVGPLDNLHTTFTYYGITENMKFYTNTYGDIYRFFGYDFKHPEQKKSGNKSSSGFGGGSGFSGSGFGNGSGFGSGSGF